MLYRIMYIDPISIRRTTARRKADIRSQVKPSGARSTNMYKVAVGISFPTDQKMKLDTYYIGSNLGYQQPVLPI